MGLLDCASCNSLLNGYDYYKEKKVSNIEETSLNIFSANVSGRMPDPYSVEIHIDHPRKSKCNCPHADGRRVVCKHMVAVYFSIFPNEAEDFYNEFLTYEDDEEDEFYDFVNDEFGDDFDDNVISFKSNYVTASSKVSDDDVINYVLKMNPETAQHTLLQLLFDGPLWQYNKFIQEHGLND